MSSFTLMGPLFPSDIALGGGGGDGERDRIRNSAIGWLGRSLKLMNVESCCGCAFWNEYCWKCLGSLEGTVSWILSSLENLSNRSNFEFFISVLNWL